MSKRIAVLVSGGGTNLQALIDAQARGELVNGEIAAVISSNPGAYALERAAKAGIPGYVVARKDFTSNREMTIALVDKLRELNIGLVVLAGFLLVGLSGVDFGEHQKKTIPLAWLVSLVMVVVAILTRGIAI